MRIVIIGGGIGGLATGIALRRMGIDAHVYERAQVMGAESAGLSLFPNAVRALDRLGVGEALRREGMDNRGGVVRTPSGKLLIEASHDKLLKKIGGISVAVHRADLQRILLDELSPHALHLGHLCTGCVRSGREVVARFANGQEAQGDGLVAADGLHSTIRSQLHGFQEPRYAGYTAWRGVAAFETDRCDPGQTWGRGMRFGRLSLTRGRVYWFATRNVPSGQPGPGWQKTQLRRLFSGWHDPIPALLAATPDAAILRNDIYDRDPVAWWGEGPVTLLGDAAHPMTPNLGQGACQALEDAIVLSNALRGATDPASAFRVYEAQRIPRTRQVVLTSRRFGAFAQWERPAAVAFRNWLIFRIPVPIQLRRLERVLNADPLLYQPGSKSRRWLERRRDVVP